MLHPYRLVITCILTLSAASAHAQSDSLSEALNKCAQQSDAEKRLKCFDNLSKIKLSKDLKVAEDATKTDEFREETVANNSVTEQSSELPASENKQANTAIATHHGESELSTTAVAQAAPKAQAARSTEQSSSQTPGVNQAPAAEAQIASEPSNEQTEIDAFGLNKPSEDETFMIDGELNSKVTEIRTANNRRLQFVLANGQIWEKTEGIKVGLPRVGNAVVVRKEALGAYYLRKANSKRSFKVKRIPQ